MIFVLVANITLMNVIAAILIEEFVECVEEEKSADQVLV